MSRRHRAGVDLSCLVPTVFFLNIPVVFGRSLFDPVRWQTILTFKHVHVIHYSPQLMLQMDATRKKNKKENDSANGSHDRDYVVNGETKRHPKTKKRRRINEEVYIMTCVDSTCAL